MADSFLDAVVLVNDSRRLRDLLAQQPRPEVPRNTDLELIPDILSGRDGEDLVDFLEGELLRLADETEDHEPGDQVQTGVEAKGTRGRHDVLHAGEGQTQNTGECVVDAHRPCHALLTLNRWEHFG